MIQEIPLDAEEKDEEEDKTLEVIEEKDEEINEIQEKEEEKIEAVEIINETPPKKPRGRPKGSTKPKKEKPPPPEKPKVVKPKPKPKKKVVHYESSSDEDLPQYVRQELPQRDLASQMMHLIQQHNNKKADARKQLYSSWFRHF